jgi:hypothetical protein
MIIVDVLRKVLGRHGFTARKASMLPSIASRQEGNMHRREIGSFFLGTLYGASGTSAVLQIAAGNRSGYPDVRNRGSLEECRFDPLRLNPVGT